MSKTDRVFKWWFRGMAIVLLCIAPLMLISMVWNLGNGILPPEEQMFQVLTTAIMIVGIPFFWWFGNEQVLGRNKEQHK